MPVDLFNRRSLIEAIFRPRAIRLIQGGGGRFDSLIQPNQSSPIPNHFQRWRSTRRRSIQTDAITARIGNQRHLVGDSDTFPAASPSPPPSPLLPRPNKIKRRTFHNIHFPITIRCDRRIICLMIISIRSAPLFGKVKVCVCVCVCVCEGMSIHIPPHVRHEHNNRLL